MKSNFNHILPLQSQCYRQSSPQEAHHQNPLEHTHGEPTQGHFSRVWEIVQDCAKKVKLFLAPPNDLLQAVAKTSTDPFYLGK
jgi:hypothetical protein